MKPHIPNPSWVQRQAVRAALALAALFTLHACCDDDVPLPPDTPQGVLTFTEPDVTLPVKGRYYSLRVNLPENEWRRIEAMRPDVTWLTLEADTVYSDGTLEFYAEDNPDVKSRTATITVTTPEGDTATCLVTQKGLGDDDGNSGLDEVFFVGYGYNIFQDYMNTRSLCAPIVDNDKASALFEGGQLVQSVLRSRETVSHIVANSLYEMSELMTRQQDESSSDLKGATKTVQRFESSGTLEQNETRYCYLTLKRTVASSSMDYSVLQQMIDAGQDVFTEAFKEAYDRVMANPNSSTVDDLLSRFGTHLVVSTELGGAMELTVNFSYQAKGEINMRADDFSRFFFKHAPSDYATSDGKYVHGVTSSVTVNGTFTIVGGPEANRNRITDKLDTSKGGDGRVDQAALQDWMNTLECQSLDNAELIKSKGLVPVNFRLVPVWSLFPASVRSLFAQRAILLSQKSTDKHFSDWTAAIDLYAFDLQNSSFMNFGTGSNQSLVRVVRASNSSNGNQQPVLEVCQEYVPVVRGDRRITVVYAIKNGRTFHGAGLFPGDGEGNPPAWLTFSDGKVYVKPISGMKATEKLRTLYYMHGNIYESDLGMNVKAPVFQSHTDQTLTLTGYDTMEKASYPIVKVGNTYWTRRNITVPMGFGEPMDPEDPYSEYYINEACDDLVKNRFYASVFQGNDPTFMWYNSEEYGDKVDDIYEEPTLWHVPTTEEAFELRDYLGNNLKSIFQEQATGFDAQFHGCYARWDDLNGGRDWGSYALRYENEQCFIAYKNDGRSAGAVVIGKDYTLRTVTRINDKQALYPVRLCRTPYYTYK